MTLNELLRQSADILADAGYIHADREASILLAHFAELDSAEVYTKGEEEVDSRLIGKVLAATRDRSLGKPLAYILGNQDFMGWKFLTDERALIPRPETEQLVEQLVKIIRTEHRQNNKVLEIGTGAGPIAISLKKYFPTLTITATDVSEEALSLAEDNAKRLEAEIEFVNSDLLASIKPAPYDLIVANLPYVPTERLSFVSDEILDWEPMVAVEASDDGLVYIKKLLATVKPFLADNALIALEMWHTHGQPIKELSREYLGPTWEVEISQDLAGFDRFAFMRS